MQTYKVWYGGDRRTLNHLLKIGAGIRHVNENVVEVTVDPGKLRHVQRIFVLDAPRTSFESALVEAAYREGYFHHA